MKKKCLRGLMTGILLSVMIVSLTPAASLAYINRGEVDINARETYSLAGGEKAYITIRPYKEDHLPGCMMDICPTECGPGCIIYIDGQMECTCAGLDPVTYYAEVEVSSSDPEVAEASYNDRGTVVITAKSRGSADIHITGAFREYTTAEKTVKVIVDGSPDSDGGQNDGNDPDDGNDAGDNGNSGGGGENNNGQGDTGDEDGPGNDPDDGNNDSGGSGDEGPAGPYSGIVFRDVNGWEKVYVYYLAELGIINGKAEGVFAPRDNVTRAEFAKILAAASGNKMPVVTAGPFDDVPASAWYAPYVTWAKDHGIVNGTGNGKFSPASEITRQDLAVMISRYASQQGAALPETQAPAEFSDGKDISGYAAEAVRQMQKAGIITGYPDGSFRPKEPATRAETAKMTAVFLQSTHKC